MTSPKDTTNLNALASSQSDSKSYGSASGLPEGPPHISPTLASAAIGRGVERLAQRSDDCAKTERDARSERFPGEIKTEDPEAAVDYSSHGHRRGAISVLSRAELEGAMSTLEVVVTDSPSDGKESKVGRTSEPTEDGGKAGKEDC